MMTIPIKKRVNTELSIDGSCRALFTKRGPRTFWLDNNNNIIIILCSIDSGNVDA